MSRSGKSPEKLFVMMNRLLAHDDRRTAHYTFLCFSAAPIAGSIASIAVIAGAVGGIIEVCRRIIPVSRDRVMMLLATPLVAYSLTYLLSLVANPYPAWKDALPVLPFLMFPFLYSSWCLSRKETVARATVFGSVVGCYGALVLAAVQFHALGIRAEGGASNPIVFATVTCLAASMALAGSLVARRTWEMAFFFGGYCAGAMAILYSGTRITWVALLLSSLAILWIFRDCWLQSLSRRTVSVLALALAAMALVAAYAAPPRLEALKQDWRQIQELGNYDSSLGRRLVLWRTAIDAIQRAPIIGTGPQSTKPMTWEAMSNAGLRGGYTHFHNGLLTVMVETGVLGAIFLFLVFAFAAGIAVGALRRASTVETRLGATMLVVVVITYLTGGSTGILLGHDILDAMLIAFLAAGGYLASGASLLNDAMTVSSEDIGSWNDRPEITLR